MRGKVLAMIFASTLFSLFLTQNSYGGVPGVWVLDGFGGVHAQGGAPAITPASTYFGWDIARDITRP